MKINIEFFKKYWIAFIPILILNIVALRQLYLQNTDYLNGWKGGGFGMFSKISERFIHIHLIDRNTFQCVKAHSDVAVKLDKISSYPNYLALENLAKLLTRKTWIEHNSINIGNTDKTIIMIGKNERLRQNDKPAKFQSLEVQIFDIKFDKRNFSIEPKLIRKMSFLR